MTETHVQPMPEDQVRPASEDQAFPGPASGPDSPGPVEGRRKHPLPLWVRSGDLAAEIVVWLILAGGMFSRGYAAVSMMRGFAFFGCSLLGVWAAVGLVKGRWRAVSLRPAIWVLIAMGFGIAWTGFQMIPLPRALAAALSPTWREIVAAWDTVGLAAPGWVSLALNPESALRSWDQAFASMLFFAGVSLLTTRRPIAARLLLAVVVLSMAEGAWGLLSYFTAGGRAVGALYNPNHHAAFILMGLPVFFALVVHFARLKEAEEDAGVSLLSDPYIFFLILGGFGALSWLVSFSRGSLIFGVGLIVPWLLAEIWVARKESSAERSAESSPARMIFGGAAFAIIVLALAWLFLSASTLEGYFARGTTDDLDGPGRSGLWRAAWTALTHSPWVGLGLGGMENALNQYARNPMTRTPIWAHNDYLQLAAELGVPAILVLWTLLFGVVTAVARDWALSSKAAPWGQALPRRAAMVGVAITLGHAIVEFHLRIPLVGFMFLILGALAITPGAMGASPKTLIRFLDLS